MTMLYRNLDIKLTNKIKYFLNSKKYDIVFLLAITHNSTLIFTNLAISMKMQLIYDLQCCTTFYYISFYIHNSDENNKPL